VVFVDTKGADEEEQRMIVDVKDWFDDVVAAAGGITTGVAGTWTGTGTAKVDVSATGGLKIVQSSAVSMILHELERDDDWTAAGGPRSG